MLDASAVRALIIDKDNTFTLPKTPSVHPSCVLTLADLSSRYKSLIVSNSAGAAVDQKAGYRGADALEAETQIEVLRHGTYKPIPEHRIAHTGMDLEARSATRRGVLHWRQCVYGYPDGQHASLLEYPADWRCHHQPYAIALAHNPAMDLQSEDFSGGYGHEWGHAGSETTTPRSRR